MNINRKNIRKQRRFEILLTSIIISILIPAFLVSLNLLIKSSSTVEAKTLSEDQKNSLEQPVNEHHIQKSREISSEVTFEINTNF